MNPESVKPDAPTTADETTDSSTVDEEGTTDFFADLMLGRDGVTDGVITHW
jgi:hypothetical protein